MVEAGGAAPESVLTGMAPAEVRRGRGRGVSGAGAGVVGVGA